MKFILGSGIIGLLAKMMLGDEWELIPFYKSRFFSLNPALDDNFIIQHKNLDQFIKDITNEPVTKTHIYHRGWSVGGQIVRNYDELLHESWLAKIFGLHVPPMSKVTFGSMMMPIYDLRVNVLYKSLIDRFNKEIAQSLSYGNVTEIGDHYLVRNGVRTEFDIAISTIPLDALIKLSNLKIELLSKPIHYHHIQTNALNFEGINQLLVVDNAFSFYKVTNIAPNRYIFYHQDDVPNPGSYYMALLKDFDLLSGTTIPNALPMGPHPKLDIITNMGIHCVGSYAQWNWCLDIGSCLLQLMQYTQNNYRMPVRKVGSK